MRRTLFLSACAAAVAAAAAFTVPNASATVIVLGGGMASDCYNQAERGHSSDTTVCDQALEQPMVNHDRAATYVNRSVLRLRGNDLNGALADCEMSIRIDSEVGEAFVNKGAALISLGRAAEAIESLSHGIALGAHKMHYAYYDRAMAREDVGDIKGAYEDYKRALQIDPTFAAAAEQLKRFRVIPASAQHAS